MSRNLPPLNALKAFEAAARHVSFTLAAAELNVTHAAISRHIRELEAWLGAKLFVRTGRGVELTERGAGYVADISRAFDTLSVATDNVSSRRRRRRQQLVVSVEPSFAALWLVPRLGRFVDFTRNEADLGVRYGRGVWANVASEELTRTGMTAVCSPGLWRSLKSSALADLPPGLLLQEESRRYWNEWLEAAGVPRLAPEGPTLGLHLTIPAAEAGQGFALADEVIAGDAIVSGRLIRPFKVAIRDYGYFFVRGADRRETKALAAFRMWLKGEMDQTLAAVAKTAPEVGANPVGKLRR
jgi:LysR family glycine cleavage system transcriptional activator